MTQPPVDISGDETHFELNELLAPQSPPMPRWFRKDDSPTSTNSSEEAKEELSDQLHDSIEELLRACSTPHITSPTIPEKNDTMQPTRISLCDVLAKDDSPRRFLASGLRNFPPPPGLGSKVEHETCSMSSSRSLSLEPARRFRHGPDPEPSPAGSFSAVGHQCFDAPTPFDGIPAKCCTSCGNNFEHTDRFCTMCGATRMSQRVWPACVSCGNGFEPEDNFCTMCGAKHPMKANAPALGLSGMLPPPGLGKVDYEPYQTPCNDTFTPEPEPSPADSVDGDQAFDTAGRGASSPPGLHMAAGCLRSSVSEPDVDQIIQDLTMERDTHPAIQRAREIAIKGGGLSGYMTLMIQQIPFECTQANLRELIDSSGFAGTYDFLYLPVNKRSYGKKRVRNRGFAFVNFLSPSLAEDFYRMYHGKNLQGYENSPAIFMIPAGVQGFEQSAASFFDSWQLRKTNSRFTPVFLKPVPSHSPDGNFLCAREDGGQ